MSNSPASGEVHVVIGGAGFLGQAIVRALEGRGEKSIIVADIRPPPSSSSEKSSAVFRQSDITNVEALAALFRDVKAGVIYHTASPIHGMGREVYEKVNVQGTLNIIKACQRENVPKLVFTSSAGVLFDGHDLVNVDERLPYPKKPLDAYNDTKARAEQLVLLANTPRGEKGLKTCAIRPAGIFGPGDRQALPGFFNVYKTGRTNVQLGDNRNLFDWTYVDNVAHAHLLAADRLLGDGYSAEKLSTVHLPTRSLGNEEKGDVAYRAVPTSEKRQATPGAPDYAAQLPSTMTALKAAGAIDLRPVVRNRFDQFFHLVNPDVESLGNPAPKLANLAEDRIDVAGEAFFITNGQPIPFWDFPRALWRAYDPVGGAVDLKKVWRIPKDLSLIMAGAAEWVSWGLGREATFTRFRVTFSASRRFYNIEKARRALDYEPIVGMEEGIRRSAEWWRNEGEAQAAAAH